MVDGMDLALAPSHGSLLDSLVVVVAPRAGRCRLQTPLGPLQQGERLGAVVGGSGHEDPILAPADGLLQGVLVIDGQPVSAGQPIAWLASR